MWTGGCGRVVWMGVVWTGGMDWLCGRVVWTGRWCGRVVWTGCYSMDGWNGHIQLTAHAQQTEMGSFSLQEVCLRPSPAFWRLWAVCHRRPPFFPCRFRASFDGILLKGQESTYPAHCTCTTDCNGLFLFTGSLSLTITSILATLGCLSPPTSFLFVSL